MLIGKDYCDYDTCVALREIGCRIQTEWYIHQPSYERGSCYLCPNIPQGTSVLDECDYIPRLSLYEAQKWLREEKKLFVEVTLGAFDQTYLWEICNTENSDLITGGFSSYDTYEEALSEGVRASIKILQDEQKENN